MSTIGAGDNFNAGFLCGIVGHNIEKKQFAALPQETWRELVAVGQCFSAHVCQSIFNYVDDGFDCGC